MNSYLRELGIPENPLPTRAVCDLVEAVKRKTVTLVSLHNMIAKKRREYERVKAQTHEPVVVKSGTSSRGGSQRPKQASTATGTRKESKSSKKASQGLSEAQIHAALPVETVAI